jgi:putative ABC transport system permease protein
LNFICKSRLGNHCFKNDIEETFWIETGNSIINQNLCLPMFRFFFKTAFRNLTRHKGFSFINIAGLTLGFTACILIGLFVWDEHQYDKFLPGGDQVYRVYNQYTNSDGSEDRAVAPPMFTTTLQRDFPEVEQTARILMQPENKTLFENGNKKIYEQQGFYADSTFFDVFRLPFQYGSPVKVLNDPASIVISIPMAKRFFGDANPVGKQILMDKVPFIVKGVFLKNPKFHLQFDYVLPLAAAQIPKERMQSWQWQQFYNYAKLKKGTNVRLLEAKFQEDVKEKSEPFMKEMHSANKPLFQALKNIHLYSANFKFDNAQRGHITYVRALTIIAIFILLIACFNFINLATAKSLQRAKEVGVRKAIGAERKQLIFQFVGETVLFTFISILISIALAILFLPWLNNFTGKNISTTLFGNPVVLLLFIALTLLVGILAGFYPALVLSNFKPVKVLKGTMSANADAGKIPWLRHSLVVVQFTFSVLLIISAIVVFKQVNYLHNKDLGFNKDQIMFFPMRGDNMFKNQQAFKNELTQIPGVSSVSIGYGFPGDAVAGDEILVPKNGKQEKESATQLMVDYDYIKTMGLQLVAGRDFSEEMGTDKDHAWIINETAVKQLGFGTPQKALGQKLFWHVWNNVNPDSIKEGQVIGVVKDFNYKSLYDKVETTVLQIFPDAAWKVAVKMKTADIGLTIDQVKKIWNQFTPDYPIEYKFLDENFEQMYKAEDKLRSLLSIFTAMAIFVGCLGLFGLAAYTAEQRRKEVGIRKVLGATTKGVVLLLSKDFVKLVVISLLIASPFAWFFMNKWLQDFAYRMNISVWIFIVAGALTILIALLTVGFQAIKAAMANPVKSLRSE